MRRWSYILIVSLVASLLASCKSDNVTFDKMSSDNNLGISTSSHLSIDSTSDDAMTGVKTPEERFVGDDERLQFIYAIGKEEAKKNPSPYQSQFLETINCDEIILHLEEWMPYATYSVINRGYARLYLLDEDNIIYKDKIIAINAGHGTRGGAMFKTFSHPDFTPKVSGGTTAEGEILSTAVSGGQELNMGISEAQANLQVATALRDLLLLNGYSVLMIRESDDCQLDNVARTVLANTYADAHVAIHFDSTNTDKGIFFITPYNDEKYLEMEPLKHNADNIREFGRSIINAYRELGEKIWKDKGELQGDLTQISYSTNPSIDIELGDKATVITPEKIYILSEGILNGIDNYFYGQELS